jgi:flagellar P-ring protein precursor FlgI
MKSILIAALAAALAGPLPAARLKELASIEGVRDNQLLGYGLVVGLNGTGDRRQSFFSAQSLTNMLQRMGVTVSPAAIQVKNTAAVMVTATLPPYAQPGIRIDVTAAAMGDAPNLQGGLLLLTSLRAADGQVYAVGQGPVVTGGFVAGRAGNAQTVNHPTVGLVPAGALVERAAPSVVLGNRVRLQLHRGDFTTAARVAGSVNRKFSTDGAAVARAESAAVVEVAVPASFSGRTIEFVAELENLAVEADRPARVVVNERTGTIAMGKEVRVSPCAIMHGRLTVEIQTTVQVSQPAPLSGGTTEVVPATTASANEERARNVVLRNGATVEELVRALTAIGSTPRDIMAILQSLRTAGALEAELEVI